jgi:cathepsin K
MNTSRNFLAGLAVVALVFAAQQSAQAASKQEVLKANRLAARLMAQDNIARAKFTHEHPGVLPQYNLALPKADASEFDWTNLNKVSDAHRQLTGDCWANSATEALECSELIRNNRRFTLSPQPVLDVLKAGVSSDKENAMASYAYKACDFFLKTGIALNTTYPYTGKPGTPLDVKLNYRAVAWGFICQKDGSAPTDEQIKAGLLKHGPLVVDLAVTAKFLAYKDGVLDQPKPEKADIKGHHAVLLVGWDNTRGAHGAWKIKNTWGGKWGEQGFIWLAYGSNDFGSEVDWVMAQSTYYTIPEETFAKIVPDAKPLPVPHTRLAKTDKTTAKDAAVAKTASEKSETKTATTVTPTHAADLAATVPHE